MGNAVRRFVILNSLWCFEDQTIDGLINGSSKLNKGLNKW